MKKQPKTTITFEALQSHLEDTIVGLKQIRERLYSGQAMNFDERRDLAHRLDRAISDVEALTKDE